MEKEKIGKEDVEDKGENNKRMIAKENEELEINKEEGLEEEKGGMVEGMARLVGSTRLG